MEVYPKHSVSKRGGIDLPITTRKKVTHAPSSYPRIICLALTISLALGMIYHLRHTPLNIRPDFNCPGINIGNKNESGAPFAPKDIQHLWGYFAPYRSVDNYKPPPPGCTVKQVNIVRGSQICQTSPLLNWEPASSTWRKISRTG